MFLKIVFSAVALSLAAFAASPTHAQTSCSGGGYAADAQVIPPADIGAISSATQHAWDGALGITTVCNLTTDGANFHAEWSLFSGEVDARNGGICVSLQSTGGRVVYSCATRAEVTAAFASPEGTPGNVLIFGQWFDTPQAAPVAVPAPAPAPVTK